jgi:hypothetical protein
MRGKVRFLFLAVVFLAHTAALAESPGLARHKLPGTVQTAAVLEQQTLLRLLRHSGPVFAGTVLQVQHRDSDSSSSLATTIIRFRVDEAVRGVRKGQIFEMKEWGALWQAGERYQSGERVLLFLYPRGKLGLTSPVGHSLGRFRVDTGGRILINNRNARPKLVELRRVLAALHEAEGE